MKKQIKKKCAAILSISMLISTMLVTPAGAGEMEDKDNVMFQIDAASQQAETSVFRHVDNLLCLSNTYWDENGNKVMDGNMAWADEPKADLKEGWADERYDNVFSYALINWAVSANIACRDGGYYEDSDGNIQYKDWNGLKEQCQLYIDGGVKPLLMFQGVPEEISAGGFNPGPYQYNERQPSDYDKWYKYLQAVMQYLVDEFGKEEVSTWAFCFWSESFGQFRAYEPETGSDLTEFLKMYDYWNAALESVVGQELYTGVYFDRTTNYGLIPFIQHCATGENYYTHETGTQLGWVGFSNWASSDTIFSGNNLDEFYYYLEDQLNKYPTLDYTDIMIVESGYLIGNADVTYAENYGASYYAWRIDQYADMPRLKNCISFYNITTGDDVYESGGGAKNNWNDNMLTPSFNVWTITRKMENDRLLQIEESGEKASSSNRVGCVATADDSEDMYKILAYNTAPLVSHNVEEKVSFQLDGLQGDKATIKKYVIDEENNNWWTEWVKYREENGIEYIPRGHGSGMSEENAKLHKTVWETTDDAGYQKWLEKIPEYKKMEALAVTEELTVDIEDGTIVLEDSLPGHSVVYMEVICNENNPKLGNNMDFETGNLENWTVTGNAQISQDEKKQGEYGALLSTGDDGEAVIEQVVGGLEPGAKYTFSGFGKPEGNSVEYRLFACQPGDGRDNQQNYCKGLLAPGGEWNNMSVTKTADENGELLIGCSVVNGTGSVYFDDLKLHLAGTGIPSIKEKENVALNKTIYASSEQSGNEIQKAVDGNKETAWAAEQATYPQTVTLDLGTTYDLNCLKYSFGGSGNYKYKIEGSVDQKNWGMLVDRTEAGRSSGTEIIDQLRMKYYQYIRLTITEGDNETPVSCPEFEVYGVPILDIARNKPVTASSNMADNPPEKAVNGTETGWVAGNGNFPQYLQVDLCGIYDLTEIKQTFADEDGSIHKYKLEGSLDGEHWDVLVDRTEEGIIPQGAVTEQVEGAYRYVKMTVTGIANNHYANSRAFQVFGEKSDCTQFLKELIEKAESLTNTGYSEDSWTNLQTVLEEANQLLEGTATLDEVCSMYIKLAEAVDALELSAKIEEITASSAEAGFEPDKVIDDLEETMWKAENTEYPQWIKADLGKIYRVSSVAYQLADLPDNAYQYRVEGSLDGTNWTVISDHTVDPPKNGTTIREEAGNQPFRYIQIVFTGADTDSSASCQKLEVCGSEVNDLAVGKPVQASSNTADNPPENAVSGQGASNRGGWVAGTGDFPQWLCVDLGEAYDLAVIKQTFADSDGSIYKYKIEGSLDNNSWDILVDRTQEGVTTSETITEEVSGNYRYVRLYVTEINNGHWASSRAFEVYGKEETEIPVESVQLDAAEREIYVGEETILTATVMPEDASNKEVEWSSSNPEVADVDNGKVMGYSAGTAVITVATVDGNFTAECVVTVHEPTQEDILVDGVTLDEEQLVLNIGEKAVLTAVVSPADATNQEVFWSSENESIVTVDGAGNVTAVAEGKAMITVTTADGGFTDVCEVTVLPESEGGDEDSDKDQESGKELEKETDIDKAVKTGDVSNFVYVYALIISAFAGGLALRFKRK